MISRKQVEILVLRKKRRCLLKSCLILIIDGLRQDDDPVFRKGFDDFFPERLIVWIEIPEISATLTDDDRLFVRPAPEWKIVGIPALFHADAVRFKKRLRPFHYQ